MEPKHYSGVLPGHLNHKHRCFSTSTPFLENSTKNTGRRFSGELFDSGLGSSISESVIAGRPTLEQTSECVGPNVTQPFSHPSADVTITHSPIFHKNSSFNTEHQDDSLEISNISFSRSRHLLRRKLNLDLDIFEEESIEENQNESKPEARQGLINLTLADDIKTLSVLHPPPSSAASIVENRIIDLDKILESCSPVVTDRLIGRKMGKKHVDVLSELMDRNISISILTILSYLDPEDLCRMCMVSSVWQSVCLSDKRANQRRLKYIKQCKRKRREMLKENVGFKQPRLPNRSLTTVLQTLASVQPTGDIHPNFQPDRGRTSSEHFMEAAKTLKNDEKLHKCPRCRKPAKVPPVQERGKCQNSDCGFDYCIKCLGEFHGSKPCTPIASKRTKTDAIGAKKSKNYLKRL